jgi:hypothetical protein
MSNSLLTSETKFVKLFPSLLELSDNYQHAVYVPKIDEMKPLSNQNQLSVKLSQEDKQKLEIDTISNKVKNSSSILSARRSKSLHRKMGTLTSDSRLSLDNQRHSVNKENVFFKFGGSIDRQLTTKFIPLIRQESSSVVASEKYNCLIQSNYGKSRQLKL